MTAKSPTTHHTLPQGSVLLPPPPESPPTRMGATDPPPQMPHHHQGVCNCPPLPPLMPPHLQPQGACSHGTAGAQQQQPPWACQCHAGKAVAHPGAVAAGCSSCMRAPQGQQQPVSRLPLAAMPWTWTWTLTWWVRGSPYHAGSRYEPPRSNCPGWSAGPGCDWSARSGWRGRRHPGQATAGGPAGESS